MARREVTTSRTNFAVAFAAVTHCGEVGVSCPRRVRGRRADISHVFFGHTFDVGTRFHLASGDGEYSLSVAVWPLDGDGEDSEYWDRKRKQWE